MQGLAGGLEFFLAAAWSILIGGKVLKWRPRISSQRTKSAAFTASSGPIVKLSPTHSAANFSLVDSPISFMSMRQRGVAGVVKIALVAFDDKAAGVSAVGAVGQLLEWMALTNLTRPKSKR